MACAVCTSAATPPSATGGPDAATAQTHAGDGCGPQEHYELTPALALRREPFGGIAYSYDTRELRIIRSPAAVDIALRLAGGATVSDVVSSYRGERTGPGAEQRVRGLIDRLVGLGVLRARG